MAKAKAKSKAGKAKAGKAKAPKAPKVDSQLWVQPGVMFMFERMYILRFMGPLNTGSTPVITMPDLRFDSTRKDQWGIPDHDHGKVSVEVRKTDAESPLGPIPRLISELVQRHGRLVQLQAVLARYMEVGDAVYYVSLQTTEPGRALVIAFRADLNADAKNEIRAKLDRGEAVDLPAHEHWLPSADALPLDAAWWIFTTLTPAQIERQACNCGPALPPQGPPFDEYNPEPPRRWARRTAGSGNSRTRVTDDILERLESKPPETFVEVPPEGASSEPFPGDLTEIAARGLATMIQSWPPSKINDALRIVGKLLVHHLGKEAAQAAIDAGADALRAQVGESPEEPADEGMDA